MTSLKVNEFRFVDGLDASYDRASRAFVLREYVRNRKAKARGGATGRARHGRFQRNRLEGESASTLQSDQENHLVLAERAAFDLPRLPSITNVLGQGRVDPFDSYACKTTELENLYLDHCKRSHLVL
jgi:hypothetical protein